MPPAPIPPKPPKPPRPSTNVAAGAPDWMFVPGGTPNDPQGQAHGIMQADGSMLPGEDGTPVSLYPGQKVPPTATDSMVAVYDDLLRRYTNGMPTDQAAVFDQQAQEISKLFQYTESPQERERLNNALGSLMAGAAPAAGAIDAAFANAINQANQYGAQAQQQGVATGNELAQLFNGSANRVMTGLVDNAAKYGAAAGYGPLAIAPGDATDLAQLLVAAAPRESALSQQLGNMWQGAQQSYATGMAEEQAAQQAALQKLLTTEKARLNAMFMDRESARQDEMLRAELSAKASLGSQRAQNELDAIKYRDSLVLDRANTKYGNQKKLEDDIEYDQGVTAYEAAKRAGSPVATQASKAVEAIPNSNGEFVDISFTDNEQKYSISGAQARIATETAIGAAIEAGQNGADPAMQRQIYTDALNKGLGHPGLTDRLWGVSGGALNAYSLFPG